MAGSFVPHLDALHMIAIPLYFRGWGRARNDHAQMHIAAGCFYLAYM